FAPSGDPWISLASVHTGRAPSAAGGAPLPADVATLAEQFAAADFETAAFVMASVPLAGTGLERGFAHFEEHDEPMELLRGVARGVVASAGLARRPRLRAALRGPGADRAGEHRARAPPRLAARRRRRESDGARRARRRVRRPGDALEPRHARVPRVLQTPLE